MASKKKKRVKKYAVGGDLRQLGPNPGDAMRKPDDLMTPYYPGNDTPDWGGGGNDDTATGQVRQISDSARMAADKLRGAGMAQQQAGSMLGNAGPFAPLTTDELGDYKKGGKVKKSAKKSAKTSVKVRGAGKAIKGVRPAKMVSMKGS